MKPAARIAAMLDAEYTTGDVLSLHTGYSASGANEVTGGTYARQSASWAAAASRSKALSAGVSFTGLPASATIKWIGVWKVDGTTLLDMLPNGGLARSFQVDLTNNKILCEGLVGTGTGQVQDGEKVTLWGTTLPTNITAGDSVFVISATAADPDSIQVSLTSGGAAIDLTTNYPSADARISKIVEEAYSGAGGQHDVDSLSVSM